MRSTGRLLRLRTCPERAGPRTPGVVSHWRSKYSCRVASAWVAAARPPGSSTTLASRRRASGRMRRRLLRLVGALVLRAQALELLGVEAHAERQPHLAQDRLDLVQRLLAEVLRLQQLGLGLLHEVGDGADVRRLEAVGGPDRQLQLVDVAEEVVVELGARVRLVAARLLLLRHRLREVGEQREVVLQDLRGLADRGGR